MTRKTRLIKNFHARRINKRGRIKCEKGLKADKDKMMRVGGGAGGEGGGGAKKKHVLYV